MTEPPFRLPARSPESHKGTYGRVGLVGGSLGMAGSISMSSMAALRTGSGLVTALVPERCLSIVASFDPCVMTIPLAEDSFGRIAESALPDLVLDLEKTDAVGCGPGMGFHQGTEIIVQALLRDWGRHLVLDADGLNSLKEIPGRGSMPSAHRVFTPHPVEFERVSGVSAKSRDDQVEAARAIADRSDLVIVLKGGPTIVCGPEGVWTNTTGNPGMATAGSGDVLTGVITSLLGQGLSAWDAARLGVWVHGHAGDMSADRHGQPGMTATDLLAELPAAIRSVVDG